MKTNRAHWAADGKDKGRAKRWSGHDGNIQRIWVEGTDPKTGAWINIGRAWRGLGQQNVLFGTESDGVQVAVPIKGTSLMASGFWMASTGAGNHESWYGLGAWGNVGPRAGINVAYALNSKNKGDVYEKNTTHLESWGEETVDYDKAYVLSGWFDVSKDVRFLADYARTNADYQNSSTFLRVNYRQTDLNTPAPGRPTPAGIAMERTAPSPVTTNGAPCSIMAVPAVEAGSSAINTSLGRISNGKHCIRNKNRFLNSDNKRTLIRTQMDFHF